MQWFTRWRSVENSHLATSWRIPWCKPRWNQNYFFSLVFVSSGAYHTIFMKWRSYSSTIMVPWTMVRKSWAF